MNNIFYIIGSGGFAKEVLFLYESIYNNLDSFGGFIDFQTETQFIACMGKSFPVIDEAEFIEKHFKGDKPSIYIGVGNPVSNARIINKFEGYEFPNLIHPNFVAHRASLNLGQGNIITSGCVFTVDIKIGSFNIFNLNTTLGHDSIIGCYNVINPGCNISGSVKIGDGNLLGTNCTILQGISIGNFSTVGAGSLATKHVADNTIVIGVPAKPMVR